MIERYTRETFDKLWSEENKFTIWLEIELLASEKMAQLGVIPKGAPARMRRNAKFSVDRILEIERTTRHDVIAFITEVGRHLGKDEKYLHLGLTSSDVVDTAMSVRMRQAGLLLVDDVKSITRRLAQLARKHVNTPIAGRTHGVFAEPTSLGLKFALWYADLVRSRKRLQTAIETISVGKLSGSVGNFVHLDPRVESYVCRKLGLRPAPISTQVIQRDRHAEFLFAVAALGAVAEKIAQEIRLLHRTEVGELTEGFFAGQRGSSSMPHKKNPIICERICGLARVLRGYVSAGLENVALWHERDISHSSVERVIVPDATTALDYMLHLLDSVIANLGIHPERMLENLTKWGQPAFSQRLLLTLAERVGSRDKAYALVQQLALKGAQDGSFRELVLADPTIREHMTEDEINEAFDLNHYLRHAHFVVRRALAIK
ncbi:MAG: adenylosuccinate lyase [Candidatus Zixiibacteriota bacterium]